MSIYSIPKVKVLIEKCIEYNNPLVLVFIDYEKSFDTIDHSPMFKVMADCRIDSRYTDIIKHVYENATACVRLHEDTPDFRIG